MRRIRRRAGRRARRPQRLPRRDSRRRLGARPRRRGGDGEDDALACRSRAGRGDGAARTVEAQPAESETELSLRGLGDLLDPVLDEALAPLPAGQRPRLSRALVLEDVEGPATRRARGRRRASRTPFARLAAQRAASSSPSTTCNGSTRRRLALSRTRVRRLRGRARRMFCSRAARGSRARCVDELCARSARRALRRARRSARSTLARSHRVVHEHLGIALPRPLLAEVHAGSPVAIRSTRSRSFAAPAHAVCRSRPVSRCRCRTRFTISSTDACSTLPAESRDFLLAAAAHAHPTISITEAATGMSCAVVSLRLRSRRTSWSSTASASASRIHCSRRRSTSPPIRCAVDEIHARLAELLEDPEARAWQLAASVDDPTRRLRCALEEAARHARTRGAPRGRPRFSSTAPEQLTPLASRDDAVRRACRCRVPPLRVRGLAQGGGASSARSSRRCAPGPGPGQGDRGAGPHPTVRGPGGGARALRPGHRRGGGRPPDAWRSHMKASRRAASGCSSGSTKPYGSTEASRSKLASSELDDRRSSRDMLMVRVRAETLLGRVHGERYRRAGAVAPGGLRGGLAYWISRSSPGRELDLDGPPRSSPRRTRRASRRGQRSCGDENTRPWLLFLLGEAERVTRKPRSRRSSRMREVAGGRRSVGLAALPQASALALESLVHAQLGAFRGSLDAARRVGDARSEQVSGSSHRAVGRARPPRALARHAAERRSTQLASRASISSARKASSSRERRDSSSTRSRRCIELGRRDEAVELLDWYEGNARRARTASRRSQTAHVAAGCSPRRPVISTVRSLHSRRRSSWHGEGRASRSTEAARCSRSARRSDASKRRARRATTLEEALGVFERIGAALWAERARAELKRISGRAATPGALTPAEERVAALVAEGKTNREVAAALFLSDRTVEGHLAHIFGKLGIRHRTEIVRALFKHRGSTSQTRGTLPFPQSLPLPSLGTGGYEGHPEQKEKQR